MLALPGECADGLVFSAFSTQAYLEWAMTILNKNGPYPTVLYLHTSDHEDSDVDARAACYIVLGQLQAGYVWASMRRSGFCEVVEPLLGASADMIRPHLTNDFVSAFAVLGTPEERRQELQAFESPSVDEIALVPTMDNDPARLGGGGQHVPEWRPQGDRLTQLVTLDLAGRCFGEFVNNLVTLGPLVTSQTIATPGG
jgi:hypothetical protein